MKEDYCTFFFEGAFGKSWQHCCEKHDKAYETQSPKVKSDVELFQCVEDTGGIAFDLIAALMFVAVSTFGFMFYKKKK